VSKYELLPRFLILDGIESPQLVIILASIRDAGLLYFLKHRFQIHTRPIKWYRMAG
jgi:hypothetical protein